MKKINCLKPAKKITALILCAVMVLAFVPVSYAADYFLLDPIGLVIKAEGDECGVKAYNAEYDNNVYISMRELSSALKGTSAAFSFEAGYTQNDGSFFAINSTEPAEFQTFWNTDDSREPVWLEFRRNRLFYNGNERKYYTYKDESGDLYMSLTDIQLMLNINAEKTADGAVEFHTGDEFTVDIDELEAEGYFDYMSGIVLGDAETGRIIYSKNKNVKTSIASTSKLMSLLIIAQALQAGEITLSDSVYISPNAEKLSQSADGIINLTAGEYKPISELLSAMMIASSNECTLAIAEHICGSEAAFVERMNAKAKELKLSTAVFYNSNGLPVYSEGALSSKKQNMMSAGDMFTLAQYLLNNYPTITEITKNQFASMPSLDYTTANSNALVFNLEGVNGLKTGSTKRAGYCLVASTEEGYILVLFGAENAAERDRASELLLRYAKEIEK